jgi:hypothetical protein
MRQDIKPRFQVDKLKGKMPRRIATPKTDEEGKLLGGFEFEEIQQEAGWMVYFPNGSSIHVWTEEEMIRQGFMDDPELVDMETGNVMGPATQTDLKALSEQKTNRGNSSKVAQQ